METIKAQCGTLIPVDKILELRPKGEVFTVATAAGSYKVAPEVVLALTSKPKRRITKKVQA